jgi:hypothetical protein
MRLSVSEKQIKQANNIIPVMIAKKYKSNKIGTHDIRWDAAENLDEFRLKGHIYIDKLR